MGILVIVLYVLAILCLGVWAMKKTKNLGDFFLGGRSIGPWMSAFAYGTTYFSAVVFIGYAGKLGWGFGLHTMWIVAGNVLIGSLLAWMVLGKRTREMTSRLDTMTMPSFLAERYKTPLLKVLAGLLIFIFLVPYSASVYMGLSYLFERTLGMDYIQAIVLLSVLTAVYLIMGGYFAVTLTDFLMGIVMVSGVGAMMYILLSKAGGIGNAVSLLKNWEICSPALKPLPPNAPPGTIPGWVTLASLVILTSLGPWGLPQMVQKFYSIKNSAQVKRAMIVATLFAVVITFGAYFTGAMTHLNLPNDSRITAAAVSTGEYTSPQELPVKTTADGNPVILPNGKPDIDWDRLMPTFLMNKLPSWMLLVIALLVFSASMSTLSSLVLVSSSAVAIDLYSGTVNQKADRKTVLLLMRVLCGLFVAVSLYVALKQPQIIINLMAISWGVLAGAFAAPYFYGLFWRRTTTAGALAGMVFAICAVVVIYRQYGPAGIPLSAAVAILSPFVVVPVVSLVTKPFEKKHLDRCFGVGEEAVAKEAVGEPVGS